MIDTEIVRTGLIRPVLILSGTHSEDAEEMMLAIMAHESRMGTYSKQFGVSDQIAAQGFFQVERPTERDIWDTYLSRKPEFKRIASELLKLCPEVGEPLQQNPYYNCFMARMKLWRSPEKLPSRKDVEAMAHYWFDHYNGSPEDERAHKVQNFIHDYQDFV